jgi:hypothetical protein
MNISNDEKWIFQDLCHVHYSKCQEKVWLKNEESKASQKLTERALVTGMPKASVVFALLTWLHITRCCWVYNACVRSVWHSQLLNSCTTKTVWENSLAKKISTTFLKWGENSKLPGSQKFQYVALIMVHSHLMLSQC